MRISGWFIVGESESAGELKSAQAKYWIFYRPTEIKCQIWYIISDCFIAPDAAFNSQITSSGIEVWNQMLKESAFSNGIDGIRDCCAQQSQKAVSAHL